MIPWAIQTFRPGLSQSRRREALLGILPGLHHFSEIICSNRYVARRAGPKVSQSQIVMAVTCEAREKLVDWNAKALRVAEPSVDMGVAGEGEILGRITRWLIHLAWHHHNL